MIIHSFQLLLLTGGVSIETDIGNGPTYTSTLSFANLQLSQSEQFTCRSQIMTPAIPGMINTTAEWDLIVTGMCKKGHYIVLLHKYRY